MNTQSRPMPQAHTDELLQAQARAEAMGIFEWWRSNAPDRLNGGFWGEIDAHGAPLPKANKGIVLNARILWFFSAVANQYDSDEARGLATHAFDYISEAFLDLVDGGVYWSVGPQGDVVDPRKRAYAQAFVIYGLAEYVQATKSESAQTLASWLMGKIESNFWDPVAGGYVEVKGYAWGEVADQRLSDKDLDAPKTMNTHLHIMEAYTRLYQVTADPDVRAGLIRVTNLFLDRFVTSNNQHLHLFFDMDWTNRSDAVSYGHDIEASWLIHEAVEALRDADLMARALPVVLGLARSAISEGVLPNGGLAYERSSNGHLDVDGEWWGQAEALVGFLNAFELTGDPVFEEAVKRLWSRVTSAFGAAQGKEWTWYAADSGRAPQALMSMWKCPYHTGRAMIELDKRLHSLSSSVSTVKSSGKPKDSPEREGTA